MNVKLTPLFRFVLPAATVAGVAWFAVLMAQQATPEPRTLPDPPREMAALVSSPARLADVAAPSDPVRLRGWTIARQGNGPGGMPCAVCHGIDGAGRLESGIPRLAGVDGTYLAKQLRDYQAGTRTHFTMQPIASVLAPADVDAVAAYFSGLPPHGPAPTRDGSPVLALGSWIAQSGIPERSVAGCNSCHGFNGAGTPPMFPRLQGQPSAYTESQLAAFRSGARANDATTLMKQIATSLTPEEAHAVAVFYESLGQQAPRPVTIAAR
jgi:cytochrome c553